LNEKALKQIIDIKGTNTAVKLTVLLDKSSLEVFVNDGEAALTTYIHPPAGADAIAVFATGGSAEIKNLTIKDLSGIKQ
jgi:fructan beta-fructosidase